MNINVKRQLFTCSIVNGKLTQLLKMKFINPNTPRLWDSLLFPKHSGIEKSPFYIDKIRRVINKLNNKKGNFLDIGFGAAFLEKELLKNKSRLQLYGIDFSHKAVKYAKQTIKGTFIIANIQKLPFNDSFFNHVVMLDVLEHIPESETSSVLNEVSRITKPKASFIVSVPINENLAKMNKEGTNKNKHLREYTAEILKSELDRSGFKISKMDFLYAFSKNYFFKSWVLKFLPKLRRPNLLIAYSRKK